MNPLEPQNILFFLSLGAGLLFMVITAVGGVGDGSDHDADHDVDGDHDHDADGDHDHDALVSRTLSLLGVGRVPFMLLLTVWLMLFGAIGFLLNVVFAHLGLSGLGWLSIIVAFISAIVLSRSFAGLFAKLLPKTESYGMTNEALCGCQGTAVYTVTETEGMVQIRDLQGGLQKVAARTIHGEKIAMGVSVEVLAYKDEGDYFVVTHVNVGTGA